MTASPLSRAHARGLDTGASRVGRIKIRHRERSAAISLFAPCKPVGRLPHRFALDPGRLGFTIGGKTVRNDELFVIVSARARSGDRRERGASLRMTASPLSRAHARGQETGASRVRFSSNESHVWGLRQRYQSLIVRGGRSKLHPQIHDIGDDLQDLCEHFSFVDLLKRLWWRKLDQDLQQLLSTCTMKSLIYSSCPLSFV